MTIARLLDELEKACEGDETTGGCLLAEAARQCNLPDTEASWTLLREILTDYRRERQLSEFNLFVQEFSPRRHFTELPRDALAEWSLLAAPSGLIGHKREIDNWQAAGLSEGLAGSTAESPAGDSPPGLSVLMAVKDGYRRLSSALYTLAEDLRHSESRTRDWQITFHVCVNFTDDNSLSVLDKFAKTVGRALGINVREYSLESRGRLGARGAKTWTKTSALNLMLTDCLTSPLGNVMPRSHFLHFADDDIKIHVGDLVVSRNIEELVRNLDAWVVGAAYSDSQPQGFARVTTVRKDPRFLESCSACKLLNIYGGAMTTTKSRLQEVLGENLSFPTEVDRALGEDAYLTVQGNWKHIVDSQQPLQVYTLMSNLVEHPEEVSIGGWARRLRRDRSWGEATFLYVSEQNGELDPQVTYKKFAKLRQESFAQVSRQIREHGTELDRVAHELGTAFRRLAKESEAAARFVGFRPSIEMTHYHLCRAIVSDGRIFDEVATTLECLPIGAELSHLLRTSKGRPGRHFPEICRRLVELDRGSAEPGLVKNPYLYNLYGIAEEATAMVAQFLRWLGATQAEFFGRPMPSDQVLERLGQEYPLNLGKLVMRLVSPYLQTVHPGESDWRIEGHYLPGDVPTSRSFSAYLTASPKHEAADENSEVEFFLRYFPCPGVREFFELAPRRRVYLQVLGRQLVSFFWGKENPSGSGTRIHLPEILYPNLTEAAANCLGPQQWTPTGRFSQSLWIERSLRGRTAPLSTTLMGEKWSESIARGLGSALGQLHGSTIGIRPQLEEVLFHDPDKTHFNEGCQLYKPEFFPLILKHVDQLRVFTTEDYEDWLISGASRSRDVQRLLKADDSHGEVLRRARQLFANSGSSLDRVWERLCHESVSAHERDGALGHLGIFRRNLRIGDRSRSGPEWSEKKLADGTRVWIVPEEAAVQELYLANHSGIAMVDPALEAGLALADILAARLAASTLGARLRREHKDQRQGEALGDHWEMNDTSLSRCWRGFFKAYAQQFLHAGGQSPLTRRAKNRELLEALLDRMDLFGAIFLLAQLHDRFEYDLDERSRVWAVRICIDLLNRTTRSSLRFRAARGSLSEPAAERM